MKTINFKGKGEHSVNELELIIEQQAEELHLIKSGQKQLILSGVMRSYILSEIESTNANKNRYGWVCKHFKRFYEGRINALENVLMFIDTENYA